MCMCLAQGGVGGVGSEWVTGLGSSFTNSGRHGESEVCVLIAVVWVVLAESGWVAWVRVWKGGVVLGVWIICVGGRCKYLYIVLGGFLRILGAPSVQSCCTLSIYAS